MNPDICDDSRKKRIVEVYINEMLTCDLYCVMRESFSWCSVLRASCRATSLSDGPEG